MKWKTKRVIMENNWLRVELQVDAEHEIQKRVAFLDEDGEAALILPGFPTLIDQAPGIYTAIMRELNRKASEAYDNGYKDGQENVINISARLNGADVIADRLTQSLGLTYDKNGYKY